jgi:hypothetical protein
MFLKRLADDCDFFFFLRNVPVYSALFGTDINDVILFTDARAGGLPWELLANGGMPRHVCG